jgi:anti-sigma factor RsiW
MSRCAAPLSFATLIAYWLGELDADAERQSEEHFFGCADCSGTLQELAALGGTIRAGFAAGVVSAVISPEFLARMKQRGMRVREYPVEPGGRTDCTITATDDAVVSRLKASLSGVARLDVLRIDAAGNIRLRYTDVPFDPVAGEVLLCPAAAILKAMPAFCDSMWLVAVDPQGERVLGDYLFDHTPG